MREGSKHCDGRIKTDHKVFSLQDKKVFLRLYTQYVRPHLEFATPAWSPWLTADKQKLEKSPGESCKNDIWSERD
jgi:hypothetical protein